MYPDDVRAGGELEVVNLLGQIRNCPVFGVVDAELSVGRTERHRDVAHDRHHAGHRLTRGLRLGQQRQVVRRTLEAVDGVDVARQRHFLGGVRKILLC